MSDSIVLMDTICLCIVYVSSWFVANDVVNKFAGVE